MTSHPFLSPLTAWNAVREAAPSDAELVRRAEAAAGTRDPAWRDQAAAAHRDAVGYMTTLSAAMRGRRQIPVGGDHQIAIGLFLASEALRRCPTRCRHALDLGRPRVVHLLLTIGLATCDACALPLMVNALEQAPGGCDWCHQPTSWFHPYRCTFGPLAAAGDICRRCLDEFIVLSSAEQPPDPNERESRPTREEADP